MKAGSFGSVSLILDKYYFDPRIPIPAIKTTGFCGSKIFAISFLNRGKSFFTWFALFIFMIYVKKLELIQVVRLASYVKGHN